MIAEHVRVAGYADSNLTPLRKLAHDPAGNDPELDPNRPAEPPTKAIDKPAPRHGKRDGSDVKAAPPAERQGNQSRAKQSNNANDNGTSRQHGVSHDTAHWVHAKLTMSSG